MRRLGALRIVLGPLGSLVAALLAVALLAALAASVSDEELPAAGGLVGGLLVAGAIGRERSRLRRIALIGLPVVCVVGLRACAATDAGTASRAWSVVVVAAFTAVVALTVRREPARSEAPDAGAAAAAPDAVQRRFRRGQLLALGALGAWLLGLGSCAVAFTTDVTNLAIAGAVVGLLLMLVPPLLLPRLLRCPACGYETLWQGVAPTACRSCGVRLR